MAQYLLQDPGERLDYAIDYRGELDQGSPSDVVTDSSWSITPDAGSPGPELTDAAIGDTLVTVKVARLAQGRVYRLTNRATTQQGLTLERTVTIRCQNR